MAKRRVKKSENKPDIKDTTVNIFYNLIIFFLVVLIVYLSYSAYLKIVQNPAKEIKEEKKEVAAEIIQLDVLNGCGVSGVADRFTDFLRAHDFDVVELGNYTVKGKINYNVDETFVIDRIGNKANAIKVAEALGIEQVKIIQQINENYFLDVSLVIGKDYYKLKPIIGSE
ncbi:MAG: LytR C-terminal domain-containing protein [Ignavibacteriales bacterium]|nr:LytR C-terminal domain-containing protein [Ignavibacteriales bacterium]MCB9217891.1 LytR C-terminal domain-containing protein [Ignavibacteriales bacterium]